MTTRIPHLNPEDDIERAELVLHQAVATLRVGQGPIARKHARARVAKAWRRLRKEIDRVTPAPPRKATKKAMDAVSKHRRRAAKMRALVADGRWVSHVADLGPGQRALRRASLLEVKVHVWTSFPSSGMAPDTIVTCPDWLVGADDDEHARKLARSPRLQEAWRAEQTLRSAAYHRKHDT